MMQKKQKKVKPVVEYGEIDFYMSNRKFWIYIIIAVVVILMFGDILK